MRWIPIIALLSIAPAAAQVNPSTLPANTVVGRLGTGSGPAQAIPFATLATQLTGLPNFVSGLPNLSSSVEGTGVPGLDNAQWFIFGAPTTPSTPGDQTLRVDRNVGYSGGTVGNVYNSIWGHSTVGANVTNYEWAILGQLDNSATAGQNVAVVGYANAKTTATSITWGGAFTMDDNTNTANPTNGRVGTEIDNYGNGTDSNTQRIILDLVGGKHGGTGTTPTITWGWRVGAQSGTLANATFVHGGYFNTATYTDLLKSDAGISTTNGIDLSAGTFSGSPFKSANYSVTSGGNVNIGPNSITDAVPLSVVNQANAASITAVTGAANNLHIAGADTNANQLTFDSFGGANSFINRRADGTAASRTGLVANDVIGSFQGSGWTSSGAYSGNAAALALNATETWSSSANGSNIKLRTTKNTTTTLADAMVIDGVGHLQAGSIAPTSVSTCGTGSLVSNSTDSAGQAIATGATACTVNFANSYASAPTCVVSDNTTAAALKVATSTGSFTVTGLTSSDTFSWICLGKVGL